MQKRDVIAIILVLISISLAITAYFILPEVVVIQFTAGSSENRTVPKIYAILIQGALGIGGAISAFSSKEDDRAYRKSVIASIAGILLGVMTIIVNNFIQ